MGKELQITISNDVKLTPLLICNANEILKLVNSNRANLARFLYWVKDVSDIASAQKYISDRISSGEHGARWFKVHFKGDFCGVFAVKSICTDSAVAELGYWLSQSTQGNGVISQIISKASELLADTHTQFIEFKCLEKNAASINIALKSGALIVDVIPNFAFADNVWQNMNIYRSMLK